MSQEERGPRIPDGTYWRPILLDGDCKLHLHGHPQKEGIHQLHELYGYRYEELARKCGYKDLRQMRTNCRPYDIIVIFKADAGIVTVKQCVVVDAEELRNRVLPVSDDGDRIEAECSETDEDE